MDLETADHVRRFFFGELTAQAILRGHDTRRKPIAFTAAAQRVRCF